MQYVCKQLSWKFDQSHSSRVARKIAVECDAGANIFILALRVLIYASHFSIG
jgi:hypothetical protein